jgi:hypothetical protein
MRSSKSRSRSKANRPRSIGNIINRVFDSSGPDGKVRGTPQQIIEKYLFLARDAQLSNDRVAAENFLQHAEHYTRLLSEAQRELAAEQEARQSQQGQHVSNQGNANQGGGNQNSGNQNGGNQNGGNQNSGGQNSGGQSAYNAQPRQNNDRNERRDDRGDYRAADPRDDRGDYRSAARPEPDDQPAMAAFEPGLPDFVQQPLIAEESTLVETPEARQPRQPRERYQQRNRDVAPTEPLAAAPAASENAVEPAASEDAPRAERSPRRPRGPRKASTATDAGGEPREAAE